MNRKRLALVALLLAVLVAGAFAADAIKVKVKVPLANVRKTADMTAAVIVQIAQGTVLDALEKTGGWYKVALPSGAAGFIHASVVDEVAGAVAPPPVQTPPAGRTERPAPAGAPQPRPAPAPYSPAPASGPKLFITVGYLAGGVSGSATQEFGTAAYQETASYSLASTFAKGGAIDVALGYMIGPSFGIKLGGNMVSRDVTEETAFRIPHPLWMDTMRSGTITGSGMSVKETHLYLDLFYALRFGKAAVELYGGPCYVLSTGTLITGMSYAESAYPYTTVTVTQSVSDLKGNAFGFNAGANVSYSFLENIGIYADVRYTSAKATYKAGGVIPDLSLTLGGFRFGGGLRLAF
jgi:hypothetical protein